MSYVESLAVAAVTIAGINPENNMMLGSGHSSDPEMSDLINPHWRTFPKPPTALNVAFGVFCFILGIVGMIGNATVIYIFSKTKRLQNPSNSLIVNLAVSDFCMMAVLSPMYFFNSINEKWIFGRHACRFYGFSGALFGTASITSMAGIALDRYLTICKPFTTISDATKGSRAKMIIAFVWAYSFTWAAPPLFGINTYVLEGFLTTCSFDFLDSSTTSRTFILAMCFGAYVAPLFLIAITYSGISCKVHTTFKRFRGPIPPTSQKDSKLSSKMRREISTAKATFIVVICWTVAWTPYAVVALLGIASYTSALTPLVAQLPAVFAKTAAVYNPFVYALTHPRYREALRGWLMALIDQRSHQSEFVDSRSSFRSRPSHISSSTRIDQKRVPVWIKNIGTYGALQKLSWYQHCTEAPVCNRSSEAFTSKSDFLNPRDVMKSKHGRSCVPDVAKIFPKIAKDDQENRNQFTGALYYPCVHRCKTNVEFRNNLTFLRS